MELETHIIGIFKYEFHSLKRLAERALAQVSDEDFFRILSTESNSLEIIVRHISGNLRSRFTDFLTSDGEKPNRERDAEFEASGLEREKIMEKWDESWQILSDVLNCLSTGDLCKNVMIRGESFSVSQALMRQIAHYANHCGQIVYLSKLLADDNWSALTIPRGQSKAWNPVSNIEQSYFIR